MIEDMQANSLPIGPGRERALRARGVASWLDLPGADTLPGVAADPLTAAVRRGEAALARGDVADLLRLLDPADHWRLLAAFGDEASYFDIETTGLEAASEVAVIACLHRGRLDTFVLGENLDGFLDLLPDVRLLVSFNGASFDVPRVERAFHIPALPCPHLDLRPVCRAAGLTGGLKEIERATGLARPDDVNGVTGEDAIWLWNAWRDQRDMSARARLLRYCAADVLASREVAGVALRRLGVAALPVSEAPWRDLPAASAPPMPRAAPARPVASGELARRLHRFLDHRGPTRSGR
jgi:hypothetical protein